MKVKNKGTNVNLHSTINTKCVGGLYNTNKLSIETQGREIIARIIDEEIWNRKVWKPPSECMNTNKKENTKVREKINTFTEEEWGDILFEKELKLRDLADKNR